MRRTTEILAERPGTKYPTILHNEFCADPLSHLSHFLETQQLRRYTLQDRSIFHNLSTTEAMNEVVIVSAARTPSGAIRGALSQVRADDLAANKIVLPLQSLTTR